MLIDDLVVLDFETTGLSPGIGDRITEVALVRLCRNRIVDRFQSLANCGVRISPFITSYTGITQKMVDGAPPVQKVIREVIKFIGNTPVIAHVASFDQRFLGNECALLNFGATYRPFICSMRVSRRVYPNFPSHALGALAERLNITFPSAAHRAGADAEVTAKLMMRMGADLGSRYPGIAVDCELLRRIMRTPVARVARILVAHATAAAPSVSGRRGLRSNRARSAS